MSSIQLPASLNNAKMDTYTRLDGADTVNVQAVVAANPIPKVTGALAALGSVTASGLEDGASAFFSIRGTYSGTFVFEASDDAGVTWFSVLAVRSDSNVAEATSGALVSISRAWRCSVAGFDSFRVRCSTFVSGSASIVISPSPYAYEPNPSIPTHAVTQSGVFSTTGAASTAIIGDVGGAGRATATNAILRSKIISAAGTNATIVKASAGRVYGWSLSNTTASTKFVKIYNLATSPVVGTTVPVETIALPPNGNVDRNDFIGVFNSAGIGIAITGGAADTDATAVAVNDVVGALYYV